MGWEVGGSAHIPRSCQSSACTLAGAIQEALLAAKWAPGKHLHPIATLAVPCSFFGVCLERPMVVMVRLPRRGAGSLVAACTVAIACMHECGALVGNQGGLVLNLVHLLPV